VAAAEDLNAGGGFVASAMAAAKSFRCAPHVPLVCCREANGQMWVVVAWNPSGPQCRAQVKVEKGMMTRRLAWQICECTSAGRTLRIILRMYGSCARARARVCAFVLRGGQARGTVMDTIGGNKKSGGIMILVSDMQGCVDQAHDVYDVQGYRRIIQRTRRVLSISTVYYPIESRAVL